MMVKTSAEKRTAGRPPWSITKTNANDVLRYLARKIQRDYDDTEEYLFQLNRCRGPEDLDAWARRFLSVSEWRSMVRALQKHAERQTQRKAGNPSRVTVELDSDVHWDLREFAKAHRCGTLSQAVEFLLKAQEVADRKRKQR